jgi:hypothetical protein
MGKPFETGELCVYNIQSVQLFKTQPNFVILQIALSDMMVIDHLK